MSADYTIHPDQDKENYTRAEFDQTTDGSVAWVRYGVGSRGEATDEATIFVHYLQPDVIDEFVKQQRKALRRLVKWNEAR